MGALLAGLGPSLAASGLSLQVTQWGAAAVSETAGWGGMVFPPPATNVSSVAPLPPLPLPPPFDPELPQNDFGARRRLASPPDVSSGPVNSLDATVLLFAQLPRTAVPTQDLFPTRGLDTRVLTVNVLSSASTAPLPVTALSSPLNITLPLRTPSIQTGSTVDIGQIALGPPLSISLQCPALGSSPTPGPYPYITLAGPPSAPSRPSALRLDSLLPISFDAPSLTVLDVSPYLAQAKALGWYIPPSFIPTAANASALINAATPLVRKSGRVALFALNCGAPIGERYFACGPGYEGKAVVFTCPRITPQPTCAAWSPALSQWSTAGCSAAPTSPPGTITCSCTHLTDFAARYVALESPSGPSIYALPVNAVTTFVPIPTTALAAFFTAAAALGVLALLGLGMDAAAAQRFRRALESDKELLFFRAADEDRLARLKAASGELQRKGEVVAATGRGGRGGGRGRGAAACTGAVKGPACAPAAH